MSDFKVGDLVEILLNGRWSLSILLTIEKGCGSPDNYYVYNIDDQEYYTRSYRTNIKKYAD
jgi:hypothetical protein